MGLDFPFSDDLPVPMTREEQDAQRVTRRSRPGATYWAPLSKQKRRATWDDLKIASLVRYDPGD